jgi:hypothetical protein
MRIQSIKKVGRKPVYDLSLATDVYDKQHYILKNGVVTHNTGIMYSANTVFIITKAQEKDGTDLTGFNFTINIEKSRYLKEKSKLMFTVLFEKGIMKWSSLFDLAIEAGLISKATQGWYNNVDLNTGEIIEPKKRKADIEKDDEFFKRLIANDAFKEFIEKKYKLSGGALAEKEEKLDED